MGCGSSTGGAATSRPYMFAASEAAPDGSPTHATGPRASASDAPAAAAPSAPVHLVLPEDPPPHHALLPLRFDVFLSHKQDEAGSFARTIKACLMLAGIAEERVFLDQDSAGSGSLPGLLNSVRSSKCMVLLLSNRIFQSQWCLREVRAALRARIPIIPVVVEHARWNGHAFPPESMIPPFIQPALERLASTYNSQYHTAFTQKLVEQIRTELDTATTASTSATGPQSQTDAAAPSQPPKAVHVTGGGDETAARVAAASAAAKGALAPVLLHRSVSLLQLPKTPEENLLISAKLANPDKKLSPDESVALLTMCIQYGRVQAERAEAKDLLIFIGNTGAGKSTLANYLAGCTLISKTKKELGMKGTGKLVVVQSTKDGGALKEVMPVGHTIHSKTFMPHIETPTLLADAAHSARLLTFADCPGFLDSRGAEINIANAVNIRAAIKQAANVRVLLLLNYHSLKAERGRGLKELMQICSHLFGSPENISKYKASLLLGVSNTPLEDDLEAVRDELLEGSSSPLMATLAERLFLYDPLNRAPRTEGWCSREELLQRIYGLTPITAHRSIFATVLTTEDESMLLHLSEQIAARIEKALNERRYRDAASAFNSLRELTVIDHVTVERLLTTQAQLVTRVVAGQVSEFKAHCHFERFHDASTALEELQLVGGAFAVSMADLVPSHELRQYLDDCKQKYQGQQQREKDFAVRLQSAQQEASQALRLMAEQKRDMELRLEEQQAQHAALIAEMKRQIADTGAEYENMKGELKKELAERMRTTQSELVAQHGQDEVELAKRMSEEQTRLQKEYDAKLHAAEVARDAVLQGQKRQQERAEKEQRAQEQATRDRLAKLQAEQERETMAAAAEQHAKRERGSYVQLTHAARSFGHAAPAGPDESEAPSVIGAPFGFRIGSVLGSRVDFDSDIFGLREEHPTGLEDCEKAAELEVEAAQKNRSYMTPFERAQADERARVAAERPKSNLTPYERAQQEERERVAAQKAWTYERAQQEERERVAAQKSSANMTPYERAQQEERVRITLQKQKTNILSPYERAQQEERERVARQREQDDRAVRRSPPATAEAIEEVEGLLLHLDPRPSHVEVPSVFEEVGGREEEDPFDDDEGEDEMETESETGTRTAAAAAASQQQHHHSSSSHAHHNISHPIHSHGRGAGRAPSSSSAAPAVASPPIQASAPAAIMDRMKTLAKECAKLVGRAKFIESFTFLQEHEGLSPEEKLAQLTKILGPEKVQHWEKIDQIVVMDRLRARRQTEDSQLAQWF